MRDLDPAATVTVPATVLSRRVGDELVLMSLDRDAYYGLDEVGARTWSLLADGRTVGEVLDELEARYEVTRSRLADDVASLVADLVAEGLLVLADPTR